MRSDTKLGNFIYDNLDKKTIDVVYAGGDDFLGFVNLHHLFEVVKELRTQYISSKSDLMFVSKQSEIAKRVEKLGLKEPVVAPMKIEIDTIK